MATAVATSIRISATRREEPLSDDGPGLTSSLLIWALWVGLAAATWATNARTPLRLLYAVDHAGVRAGAGRALVLLCWPVALSALPLVAIALERLLATPSTRAFKRTAVALSILAVALCATILLPGALDPDHLDAKPINAPAAVGVAIAFGLTLWALARTGRGHSPSFSRADLYWVVPSLVLLFGALPWMLANLGFYAGDVPGLHAIFMSKQVLPEAGHPHLVAVHLGNHDGFNGLLLALSSLVLMRSLGQMRRLRTATGVCLALFLAYGLAVATSDWWYEQIVKRGTLTAKLSSPIYPSLTLMWATIIVAAVFVYLLERRVLNARHSRAVMVRWTTP